MTRDKNQPQQVVAHIVVESRIKIGHGHLFRGKFAAKLLVLTIKTRVSTELVYGTMFRGGHQPCARIIRDARLRPSLERGDQSVLCEIFGEADIAHDTRERGDEPG